MGLASNTAFNTVWEAGSVLNAFMMISGKAEGAPPGP